LDIVLVGNQALMKDHGIAVSGALFAQHREASEIFVARSGQLPGARRAIAPGPTLTFYTFSFSFPISD
jgi:hypothetical protein